MPGVLVLVQQHGRVAGPLGPADLGEAIRDPGRDGHLVAEVDRARPRLRPPVALHQRQQRRPGARPGPAACGPPRTARRRPRGRWRCAAAWPGPAPRRSAVHRRSSSGSTRCSASSPARSSSQPTTVVSGVVQLRHVQVVRADHPLGELPGHRLGEQPHGRLDADPQPVLGDQPARVRVVGRDGRLAGQQPGPPRRAAAAGRPRSAPAGPDPVAELAGRLAGEGQAEHLVRAGPARWRPARPPGRPSSRSCRSRRRRRPPPGRAGRR